MNAETFGKWYGEHYNELLAVALRRLDRNYHDAEDAVQTAAAWACDVGEGEYKGKTRYESFILTRKKNSTRKFAVWPQMVQAVTRAAGDISISQQRATAAQSEGGAVLQVEKGIRGKRTAIPTHEEDGNTRVSVGQRAEGYLPEFFEKDDEESAAPGAFGGPTGWAGEYNVHHLGPCKCRQPQTTRIERGKDVDRRKVNSALAGRLLSLLQHGVKNSPSGSIDRLAAFVVGSIITDSARGATEYYTHSVLGCWGGHRTYLGDFGFDNFKREGVTPMFAAGPKFAVVFPDGSLVLRQSSVECAPAEIADRKPWTGGPHEHAKFKERQACSICRMESQPA